MHTLIWPIQTKAGEQGGDSTAVSFKPKLLCYDHSMVMTAAIYHDSYDEVSIIRFEKFRSCYVIANAPNFNWRRKTISEKLGLMIFASKFYIVLKYITAQLSHKPKQIIVYFYIPSAFVIIVWRFSAIHSDISLKPKSMLKPYHH